MTEKTRHFTVGRMQISVLWRHMLLMLVVLALSLTALLISNKISLDTLEKEKYLEIQTALDRNCNEFTTEMLMTGSLSNAVTGNRYYDYIRGIRNGVLPERYFTVLPLLQNVLSTQVYLRGDASITLMYLSGCNSLVSTVYVTPTAEDFFDNIINFPETPTSVLIGYLKSNEVLKILPMQEICINVGSNPGNISEALPVIIRDLNAPASIMSLYPREVVLRKLGLDSLPADTYIQMTADDGQILLRYPEQFDAARLESERIRFDTSMNTVHANVSIWVSRDAFTNLLRPARLTGSILVVLVALVGLVLTFVLSRISVDPLRKLVAHHSDEPRRPTNEIIHLNSILSRSREKVQDLESALVSSLLAKVFSGIVLSEEDEEILRTRILPEDKEYRAAILGGQPEAIKACYPMLKEELGISLILISPNQAGVLFPGEPDALEAFIARWNQDAEHPDLGIRCGISAPFSALTMLSTAIRQARFAAPANPGTKVFQGDQLRSHIYSRLQHERLYQSIFQGDQEGAMAVLDTISQQLTMGSAREIYYNVRFTLRCAAEEMELGMSSFETEYMPDKRPRENMNSLREMLNQMFHQIQLKSDGSITTLHDQVLEWIRENAFDPNLCVASIGEHFSISKNKVYDIVRSATDMGLNEYILSIRMKKAGNLLYSTQLSVGEVALQCGYLAESTFYRVFKKYYNLTPIQYRQNGALPGNE